MGTVQHFRQTKELTTAVMENLKKSKKEADTTPESKNQ